MRAFVWVATALLLAGAVAGCSSKRNGDGSGDGSTTADGALTDAGAEQAAGQVDVKATATTGIIRGVVVDQAIHPLTAAKVTIRLPGKPTQSTNTSATGAFGFHGLQPGTYFVIATKVGYSAAQSSVEVKAGVDNPPAVKILLQADPSSRPYYELYHWTGYIECSTSTIYVGFAACGAPNTITGQNVTQDNFLQRYAPSTRPMFAQSEMVWQSTQTAGSAMSLGYEIPGSSSNFAENASASPVIIKANQTKLDKNVNGTDTPLTVRVFSVGADGTGPESVPWPCAPPEQVPSPVGHLCSNGGVGATVEQQFDVYTVLFYGFRPPLDYSFVKDGEPQVPS